jgi:hypothetical protein
MLAFAAGMGVSKISGAALKAKLEIYLAWERKIEVRDKARQETKSDKRLDEHI